MSIDKVFYTNWILRSLEVNRQATTRLSGETPSTEHTLMPAVRRVFLLYPVEPSAIGLSPISSLNLGFPMQEEQTGMDHFFPVSSSNDYMPDILDVLKTHGDYGIKVHLLNSDSPHRRLLACMQCMPKDVTP